MNNWDYYPTDSYPFYGAERGDANRGGVSQPWGNVACRASFVTRRCWIHALKGLGAMIVHWPPGDGWKIHETATALAWPRDFDVVLPQNLTLSSVIALFILYWEYVLKNLSFLHRLRLPTLASATRLKSQDSLQSAVDLAKRRFSTNIYVLCLQFKSEQRDFIAGKWWSWGSLRMTTVESQSPMLWARRAKGGVTTRQKLEPRWYLGEEMSLPQNVFWPGT